MTNEAHYKYLLKNIGIYKRDHNFDQYWDSLLPMFKQEVDILYIFLGLRRFLLTSHKTQFDSGIKKHFFVV